IGLISAGYMMLGQKILLGKTVETKAGQEKSVDAIVSWSVANGRLPKDTEFTSALPNQNDSWGKSFYYMYDDTLANTLAAGYGGLCGKTHTNLTVQTCPDAICAVPTNITPDVAFVLLSGGSNLNNQTRATGPITAPTTVRFYTVTTPTDNYVTDILRIEPYDDLNKVVTLAELKSRAGCYGSTGGRLKILNNELPKGCSGTPYLATVFGGGGVAPYQPYTITGLPAGLSSTGPNISGSPSTTGSFPVTIQITDSQTPTATVAQKNLTLTVNSCGASLPTPAAAWAMNEGTGNTIGSGSTLGTISGTANWVARGGGYALLLNGTNNYIYFNDINYFNIGTGNMTLSAWVNFSGMPAQHWCDSTTGTDMAIGAIAGKGFLYPAIGYGMYVTQTRQCTSCTSGCGAWSNYKVAFQLRNPANTDIHSVYSDVAIAGGSWAHLVAVLDRGASPATDQIKLYINGIKQTDASNDYQYTSPTALNFDNTFKFTIGARHDGGSGYGFPYWGYIDDVQLYKVALTDAQISTLYTTGLTP
ncbi:MAG: LamG domain-containing protein, partial [Trichlorobacter sp.]|uniref:LamG domain-containing protein n=1 Tax=Trichlorobacter sp. TaxID=2911007 RepID=UPI00256D4532